MSTISTLFILSLYVVSIECKVDSNDDGTGTISFNMDKNDQIDHDFHMPDALKCDSCLAIAYVLKKAFREMHSKRPSVKKFDESDVLDITESSCEQTWEGYGVKQVNGVHRLAGEGLDDVSDPGVPTVVQHGGKMPERLKEVCLMYMGELGEMEIYNQYLASGELESYLCRGPGVRSYCGSTLPTEASPTNDEL